MFGNAAWFKTKEDGGLAPSTWQGWAYFASWGAAVTLPAIFLTGAGVVEPLIWAAVSSLAFLWDLRKVRRAVAGEHANENVFVIDENTDVTQFATRNFDMKLRD